MNEHVATAHEAVIQHHLQKGVVIMLSLFSTLPALDRVFDDVMRDSAVAFSSVSFAPSVDVTTDDDRMVFSLDVPGVKAEDLSVEIEGHVLVVRGERKVAGTSGQTTYGRRYGSFAWSWALPEGMDTESLQASLDSGVLTIQVAKHPKAKPRKIPILSRMADAAKQLVEGETTKG